MTLKQRMNIFRSSGLYFVTSEILSKGRSTCEIVDSALSAGVKLIQLREKDKTKSDFYDLAVKVRKRTLDYGALLIINDYLDIALAVEADGVHLGQDDLPVDVAVRLAPEMIIGASTHDVQEAQIAESRGCSYLNIGPIYPTDTKNWQDEYLGLDGLDEIARTVSVPFTVMGGIKKHHIPELKKHGANIIALVTAVTAADNPETAAKDLLNIIKFQK
jgi:thiamine-phosphate pyrophosphorylase